MRTRQKCNPEYIPYIFEVTCDQRSYLMDRAEKNGKIEEIQRTLNC